MQVRIFIAVVILALLLSACGGEPTLAPEEMAGTALVLGETIVAGTSTAVALLATDTPIPPTATFTPTVTQTPTFTLSPTITETPTISPVPGTDTPVPGTMEIYFVYLNPTEDDECGYSLVPVSIGVLPSGDPQADVATVLGRLFSTGVKYVGGLYNPLYASTVQVDSVSYDSANQEILVQASGPLIRVEDCDWTYIRGQVNTTVNRIPGVSQVEIKLNGHAFNDLVSTDKSK